MPPPNPNGTGNDVGAAKVYESGQRPTKRRRTIYVCDLCRVKKNRCDGERPACGACQRRQTECVYAGHKSYASGTQRYIDSLKARNHILEQQLAAQSGNGQNFPLSPLVEDHGTSSPAEPSISTPRPSVRDTASTQSSSMHGFPHLLSHNGIPHSNSRDHQAQWRMSPRVISGEPQPNNDQLGSSRHIMDDEPRARNLPDINEKAPVTDVTEQSSEYFGESSTFDFMTKVCSPRDDTTKGRVNNRRQSPASAATSLAISSPSAPIFDGYLPGLGSDDLYSLPNRFIADRLVDAYFKFVHPLNTYLHEYSFRQRYEYLWVKEDLGGEEAGESNLAWFGLVNLIFAFGSDHAKVVGRISVDNTRFFKRAKTLVFSGLFQAASIELVQALLLMGQYLHSSLELDNSWTVVGLAIRMAQSLGLHLHSDTYTLRPIDEEVRKRVWWGCFVLDRLLSMKVGRPPTICDGPDITVGMPLAIDDEYLKDDDNTESPIQPTGIPSKFEFITYAITQCRLLERICKTIYSRGHVDISKQGLTYIPKLLALSIELDGDLLSWQQTLPSHLRFDSHVQGWEFERQRSTLLMRFLNSRLLLHRQILLIYVTRQCPDNFQRQIMYPCVQRCVMAAHDTISEVRILSQRRLLHSWWHNSHSVFTALCVMLAFKMLSPQSKAEVGLLDSVDVDKVISQGTGLLQEVGERSHPLASRYLHWFQKLEKKLPTLSLAKTSYPDANPTNVDTLPLDRQRRPDDENYPFSAEMNNAFVRDERPIYDSLMISSDELLEIESMFCSTGWANAIES